MGHNFVLVHASGNAQKSDWLPAAEHLNAWVEHNQKVGLEKGSAFEKKGVIHLLATSARIVDWAYKQTFEMRGRTWLRAKEFSPLPDDWNRSLVSLVT